MEDFEKLGVFFLGREYDLERNAPGERLLLYDSKDLVTHAVCVGMTGSGKTGLCLSVLEEAAIDGIPSVVVDPKGDLANLLLTFPALREEDFLPWVNEDDARTKGLSAEEYARRQAALWARGLGEWGMDGGRIKKLQEAADFTIYTPGSSAGFPVSILRSFAAPGKGIVEDTELLGERINTTVTGLLGLLGIEADPVQSREHILLSTILAAAWKQGNDLDLAGLIQAVQSPPVKRIGVFELESFFPSKDRFSLAMKVNNLLAAPHFAAWLEGEPLDIDRMFYTPGGKPRVSIFSIAHLSDAERMFFVSLLLTQLLGWMRAQSGTTSLRSVFYMDEIFGYFPPVANPPSKAPLMSLLKQARAFGLGIVLATQNPVDLDYKGLSNTGTWFIGRLQTERDRQRVLDGLEGAGSSIGGRFERGEMERILGGLGPRLFLLNNVHEDAPVVFQSRWVMSYLRGPLTRTQIKQLMDPRKASGAGAAESPPQEAVVAPAVRQQAAPQADRRPGLPPDVPQFFLPPRGGRPEDSSLFYEPTLLGIARLYFADARVGIAVQKEVRLLLEFSDRSPGIDWGESQETEYRERDLDRYPQDREAVFGDPPGETSVARNYPRWRSALREWLYRNQRLHVLKSPSLGLVSEPDEPERDFRIRLQQAAREERDRQLERLRQRYASRIAALEDRIRRAQQALDREKEQASQQKFQTMISFGATLLTALTGRKRVTQSTLGRAATTARGAGRIMKESKDVERAAENIQALEKRLGDLQAEFAEETEHIRAGIDSLTEPLVSSEIRPKKIDISVSLVALTWVPYWRNDSGDITPAC